MKHYSRKQLLGALIPGAEKLEVRHGGLTKKGSQAMRRAPLQRLHADVDPGVVGSRSTSALYRVQSGVHSTQYKLTM